MTLVSQPQQPPADAAPKPNTKGRGALFDELAQAAKPPDLAVFVRQHQASVWRYLRYLGAKSAEADDLTQETFLALAKSGFTEQSELQTASYLRTVARRQLLLLRRTQKRQCQEVQLEAAETVWADSVVCSTTGASLWDDHVEAARRCVDKLEGRSRQAIDLMYRESTSREAIAQQLGMTADGVKTLLRRTRTKLRECIEKTLAQTES